MVTAHGLFADGTSSNLALASFSVSFRIQDPEFHFSIQDQDIGSRLQGSGFRIQDSGFRMQDVGFRIQDAGCEIQDSC